MFLFNRKKDVQSPTVSTIKPNVILTKAQDGLERHLVNLKKNSGIDLGNHKSRVFVVLDRSGSMHSMYHDGKVQEVLTRLLPLALKFDDNGELEVFLFNERCSQMKAMTQNNYDTYVQQHILRAGYGPGGGTNYAPAIEKTISIFNDKSPYPAFGLFITDGDNFDKAQTDQILRKSANYKLFYQFVGIGNSSFPYLERIDDLDGRAVDNTAFIKVSDFARLNDDQLYAKLLEQYPAWLQAMHII